MNSQAVSVVIPARNASKTIRQTVNSVLMQLEDYDELIVLNDSSEDDTLGLLRDVIDSRVRIISSSKQLGVAKGANLLLHEARNDLVARLDSDDLAISGRIDFQRNVMVQNSSLSVIFMSQLSFGRKLKFFLPLNLARIEVHNFPWALLMGNPVCHSSSMMRRSRILGIGGYRDVVAEDYDLWIRCVLNGMNLEKFRKPGVLYRKHGDQLTRQVSWLNDLKSLNGIASSHHDLTKSLGWLGGKTWQILQQRDLTPEDEQRRLEFLNFVKTGKRRTRHGK